MEKPMEIKISVMDMEPFKSIVKYVGGLVMDERIPHEIRTEIMDQLEKLAEGN